MEMRHKLEINRTLLLTIPCVVPVRGGGLCSPGFQRGHLPPSSTEPQAGWGGTAHLRHSTSSQDSPSTLYTQQLHYSLNPLINAVRKRIPRGWGCREFQRAVQDSAGVWPCHSMCCPHLLLLLLRTLPTGRKAQDAFLSEGRKQHWRWAGFPRASWDAAHPQGHPLLHPKGITSAAIPPWLIIQEPNLWLIFQGNEQQQWHGSVLRAPPTQGINPAIWDDLSAPLWARLPPDRYWVLISRTRRQVFTPGESENMYCKQIINPRKYVFCILSICLLNRIVKIWTKPPKPILTPKSVAHVF